jgi:glutamyl-tRNA synthetase
MAQKSLFYFREIDYEPEAVEKFLISESLSLLEELLPVLTEAEAFTKDGLEGVLAAFIETHGIKLGVVAQPLRVALTGTTVSPGIFEVMEVMGRDMVLGRLSKAIAHIKAKKV